MSTRASNPAYSMSREKGGEKLFEISIAAQPDRLKLIRAAVREAGKMCHLSAAEAHDLMLAVDEACQNVIRHAYNGDKEGIIIVRAFRGESQIIVEVQDFAPTVDIAKIKPRDLGDVRPGGLGTHFIQELLDEACFIVPEEGGNLLRMVKRGRARQAGP